MKWQSISMAKSDGKSKVLYFPPQKNSCGQVLLGIYYKVDTNPNPIPRKATHFLSLPAPPEDGT